MNDPRAFCVHAATIRAVTPSSPDSCAECLALGDTWMHLRICLVYGHVGCCDSSKNRHARKHFHSAGHAVMQSFEPGEAWRYCFADDLMLTPAEVPFRS